MAQRTFRAWYTHDLFQLTLEEIQKCAKRCKVTLADPDNPTPEELAKVYKKTFEEMSDPNGRCSVEEITEREGTDD